MRNSARRPGSTGHQRTGRRIVAACMVLTTCCAACAGSRSPDESAIAQSDRDYEEAQRRNDVVAVNALLAPEYYVITSGGERSEPGNSGVGPSASSPDDKDRGHAVVNDHRIRVYGDTAVSTYNRHSVVHGADGRTRQKDVVRTNVWVRHLRRWRLALSHATTVEQ